MPPEYSFGRQLQMSQAAASGPDVAAILMQAIPGAVAARFHKSSSEPPEKERLMEALGEPVVLPQEHLARFATGAVRGTDADGQRWDLITPIGLRRLAETCAEGAAKYGEHNWQKGIPASVMLNHAIRHVYLYLAGDASEDHLAHAAWNILGVCHFEEAMPEMIDLPARNTQEARS